jgi:hypothetical protein
MALVPPVMESMALPVSVRLPRATVLKGFAPFPRRTLPEVKVAAPVPPYATERVEVETNLVPSKASGAPIVKLVALVPPLASGALCRARASRSSRCRVSHSLKRDSLTMPL